MANKYLDAIGLNTFINKCREVFADKQEIQQFKDDTEYVVNLDYTDIEFDTKESYTNFITLK